MGLILEDQRRALDYLESLPFVDRKRIGVAGVSMGGEISLYLAAIDPRVKSAIIMGWLTSWEELGDDMPDWKIPNIETNFPTMAEIGMLIAPRFALYHTGMSDPLFSEQLSQGIFFGIKNYYQKLGVENRVRFESRGVGHAFVNDLAISFFKETLNQYTSTSNLELLF
jgi:pimeloyl-ACP methyl ester carboxylesterase